MGKLPAFQFYPGDWLKDPDLRRCSKAAKGVWIDMLCLMFECPIRGVLADAGGSPWSDQEIAEAVGGPIGTNLECIAELVAKNVASRDNRGAIFSRRLVRDEEVRRTTAGRVRNHRSNASVTLEKRACTVDEDEDVKKEKRIDELVFDVLAGLSIPTSNPILVTAIGEAIEAKGKESGWSKTKAALHFVERGNAYKSSAQWHSQFKKSWPNWFKDQCYDQDPSAWKPKAEQDQRGYIPLKK